MYISSLFAAVEPTIAEGIKALPPAKQHELRALLQAFAGLSILAFALVGIVWWTAYMLRRRLRRRLGATQPVHDAWYQKPAPTDSVSDLDEPRS